MFSLFRGRPTEAHPTAVERVRYEPVHPRAMAPIGSPIDAPTTRRELAPQPVPSSAYDGIGKRAPEMVRPAILLDPNEWLSVVGWPFATGRPLVPMRVPIAPHQGMMAQTDRVNIDMPAQTTLGTLSSIKATPYTGLDYLKLGGIV